MRMKKAPGSGTVGKSALLVVALALAAPSAAFGQGGELKPGDVVRLSISREENMSGDYPVDQAGQVALPLIGVINVQGVPADRLRQEILDGLQEQLRNQTISVMFLRRIRVLGEVKTPGLYHVDPTMTVIDAVALAGGPTDTGSLENVSILRGSTEIQVDLSEPVLQQVESGDQIVIGEKGWWTRNGKYVLGTATTVSVLLVRWVFN